MDDNRDQTAGEGDTYNWAREYPDFGRLSCVALANAKHCGVFTRKSSKAGVEGERVSSPRVGVFETAVHTDARERNKHWNHLVAEHRRLEASGYLKKKREPRELIRERSI